CAKYCSGIYCFGVGFDSW
nr:immunoglobulin heavy chain junction region [Macaca mulatta]MOW32356.1 immunoglobulin heavy chain junction region [Macaca mulatta]MOW32544.1 immunoglobulin heavy chain junction region [Macaca mulatta]MOW32614.1 immunoglobulin heavy chain junction region [Macaca mulatta]MOW32662.1 immunoglobulin heavy chain junction region [Macaca mulatta]